MKTDSSPSSRTIASIWKNNFRIALALAAAQVGLCTASAQMLTNNFNSSGDMDGFNQYNSSGTVYNTTTGLRQVAGVGTGGTGGMQYAAGSAGTLISAIYNPTTFSFSEGTSYLFSLDFQKLSSISSANPNLLLGFTSVNNKPLGANGSSLIGFQVLANGDGTAKLRWGNGSGTGSASYGNIGSNFSFSDGTTNWFRLTATMTLVNSATSEFSYSVNLYDIGSDGTAAPGTVLASGTGNITNSTIASASSLYAGFNFAKAASSTVDNLSIVPEPKSAALLMMGAGGIAVLALRGKAIFR